MMRAEVEPVVDADAAAEDVPVAVAVLGGARQRHEAGGEHDGAMNTAMTTLARMSLTPIDGSRLGRTRRRMTQHDQRPHQVELLLHRQRPQVPQRDERLGRRVYPWPTKIWYQLLT